MAWTCLLCQQNSFEKVALHVRDSYDHGVVKCATCGHVQLHPVPSEEELTEYYRNETQRRSVHGHMTREEKRLHVKADTDRRVALIESLAPQNGFNGSYLDIGSGEEFLQEELSFESDWQLITLECWDSPTNYVVDVVSMFHVLEHVVNPVNFIEGHWGKVQKTGYLIIEVPNHDDWLISACHEYRAWHYQRAHIHYFTPRTLLSVVNQSGIQYRNLKLFGVQRYPWEQACSWQTFGHPIDAPIGEPKSPLGNDEQYRQLHESTLTSDTLCLILQK